MARTLPVASGVLKHQLYIALGSQHTAERGVDEAVLTFWTWKTGGSPVGSTRINAEQAAIIAWVTSDLRGILPPAHMVTDVRTWDYGLDPAPRTATIIFPHVVGTASSVTQTQFTDTWLVPLRSQAIGSAVRNRLNGRLNHPVYTDNTGQLRPTGAAMGAAYRNLLSARLNGSGSVGAWSIISYYSGSAPRGTPLVVPINHVPDPQRLGSRRSRRARPGPYPLGF